LNLKFADETEIIASGWELVLTKSSAKKGRGTRIETDDRYRANPARITGTLDFREREAPNDEPG